MRWQFSLAIGDFLLVLEKFDFFQLFGLFAHVEGEVFDPFGDFFFGRGCRMLWESLLTCSEDLLEDFHLLFIADVIQDDFFLCGRTWLLFWR